MSSKGNVNLSPFSFFNVMSTNPPTLVFSPNLRVRDGSTKHTLENVKQHQEVVIHAVDFDMVEQMSLSSCEFPEDINEFEKSGFTAIPSDKVAPPRIKEAKAAFECKVIQVISLGEHGGAGNMVICEVVLAHFDESILNPDRKINQLKTDWVARMGGDWYARANSQSMFAVAKPNMNLGIGVDKIPTFIKNHPMITGNDLGRLGNISNLPTQREVESLQLEVEDISFEKALSLLRSGDVELSWRMFLAIQASK
jgi:flavin reductase (DIM6/NTAB) family NADH-FMN oxidoreductase RutF